MASATLRPFLLLQLPLILLSILISTSVEARPLKTLFISSDAYSYSFSLYPISLSDFRARSSSHEFVAIFSQVTQFRPSSDVFLDNHSDDHIDLDLREPRPASTQRHPFQDLHAVLPVGFSYDFTSLRDRTKDILSVVVALLFGVGCGALTAATMYLAYFLYSNRFGYPSSLYDDDRDDECFEDEENVSDLKKMGYFKIPDDSAPSKTAV